VLVGQNAGEVRRALQGGYRREEANGPPVDNIYNVLMEGLESAIAHADKKYQQEDLQGIGHTQFGVPYKSACPEHNVGLAIQKIGKKGPSYEEY
jgi:hypothetical protein